MLLLGASESVCSPDLRRPKVALLVTVFVKVGMDPGLLEQGPIELERTSGSFLFGGGKEAREILADKIGNVLVVEVILNDSGRGRRGCAGPASKVGLTLDPRS